MSPVRHVRFEVCDGCVAGLDKNYDLNIHRCQHCKRTGCPCLVRWQPLVLGGYQCVPDVDGGCMESVSEATDKEVSDEHIRQ